MHQYYRVKFLHSLFFTTLLAKFYLLFVGRLGKNLQSVKCEWKTRLKSNNNDKEPSQLLREKCESFVTSSTHDDGTCIIEIKNKNFQKTRGTILPDICFWSQSRFESFLSLSGGTALDWKNPKPEPQPRGVLKGIFHKTTLHSHIRSKAVFFTLPSILKHLVKEGRQTNKKISLKPGYKNDPFVHQQLQHSLHCVSNNWNILQ